MGYKPEWKLPRKSRYQDIEPCRRSLADREEFLKYLTEAQKAYLSTSNPNVNTLVIGEDELRDYIRGARTATRVHQDGDNIVALIEASLTHGLTVANLAAELGVSEAKIRRWRRGEKLPSSQGPIAGQIRTILDRVSKIAARERALPLKAQ